MNKECHRLKHDVAYFAIKFLYEQIKIILFIP